jgi:hypothetical protein
VAESKAKAVPGTVTQASNDPIANRKLNTQMAAQRMESPWSKMVTMRIATGRMVAANTGGTGMWRY